MGRKRKGRAISGWLIVDKPAGKSSSAVVTEVRRLTGAAKAGHGGTLDPLATGVLPIALGEATKTSAYAMDGTKRYRFTVRWGVATETDDAEGETVETSDVRPSEEAVRAALDGFTGEIEQVPPAYSAVKVDGRRAYELARADEDVTLESRIVHVHEFSLVGMHDEDHAEFEVECGKGTYMRSLARDLARALGTCGHIAALRRTAVGPFTESRAISLEKLAALGHSAPLEEVLLPIETVLDDIPALALTVQEANRLRHGQPVAALPVATRSPLNDVEQGDVVCAMAEGRMVALARLVGGEIRPLRVMNV